MAYNYYYNGSGTSGGDDWTADDAVYDEGGGIVSDLGPTPTYGDDGIDPSLLQQPGPGYVYPPSTPNAQGYNPRGHIYRGLWPTIYQHQPHILHLPFPTKRWLPTDRLLPSTGERYRFDEDDPPSVDNYPQERNGDYLCNRFTPKGAVCGKAFREKNILNDGQCSSLGRGAEQKDVRRHVVAHHPEWARQNGIKEEDEVFQCGCGMEFTRGDNLKKHQKKYHHR
ncbi:hypothetical protein PG993_009145 [Apiospora rasikravindrae]|uniref:C2H2-type domain-containing protein n=1 Tax=Apiospora rasikravindrae TaxID=990691 RepID=A0ABR1SII8_9PEZI